MSGLQRMFVLLNLVGLSVLGTAGIGRAESVELTQERPLESRIDEEVLFTSASLLVPEPSDPSALMAQMDGMPSSQPMPNSSPDATIQPGEAAPGNLPGEPPLETVPTDPATGQTLPNPLERPAPEIDAFRMDDAYPADATVSPTGETPDTTYPDTLGEPYGAPSIEAQDPSAPSDSATPDPAFGDETPDPTFDDGLDDPTFDDSPTEPDPAFDEEAQTDPLTPDTSDFSPGRATRSGPSYIGVGGNIGLGDGSTALGEGSFAIFSKVGVTPNISVRPSVLFSDDPTILLPVTIDFIPLVTDATENVSAELGLRVSPFVGAGAAFSTGDDSAVDFLATAGVDIGLTESLTGVVSVSASLFDNPAIGLLLGVGYNF